MRKFVKNVLAFGTLVGFVLILLEVILWVLPNEYTYKRNYLTRNCSEIKTLVLGNSHLANGIDPFVLGDSVFNAAISGRIPYYDAVVAEQNIPRLKKLENVIWTIGYNFHYLDYQFNVLKSINDKEKHKYYMHMYEKYMLIPNGFTVPYLYWSSLLYEGNIITSIKESMSTKYIENKGLTKLDIEMRSIDWKQQQLPPVVDYENNYTTKVLKKNLNIYKRIAKVCKDNHIRLIVLTTPCYKTYLEETTERGVSELYNCIDTMRTVYPSVEYYNFIKDLRFNENDFINSSHLNSDGVEKFSKIVKDTLNL